ncbi:PREDICTED: tastin [Condylura cristata]|uniref:tastin n=1 Tax=Condylura cristata TaxID=143302 RepID=UPI0006436D37|nr:PREDICTED: tastin [Condylura cristata]
MTSLQARKDSSHRGVAPTPSKIPVRPHRCPALPAGKPSAGDQENQDPRRMVQKLSSQPFLHGSADPTPKAAHQTEKSESLVGSTQHRNPLEELRPSPGGQSMGPGPPPQTEAPGAIEFVADPAALATILSGEGVKSCHLGRQPSLAQRVLIRGSQGGTLRRGQGARASAYLAPRTPIHRLDPARASCFSRLQGPGPRSQTLRPQRSEELELRRETGVSSRTSVSQAAELLLGTPVKPASSFPGREHEIVTHSDEGGGPLGLAQRVPLRENKDMTYTRDSRDCHPMPSPGQAGPPSTTRPSLFGQAQRVPSPSPSTRISYSVLRRLASHSKAQLTPIPQAPKVQQVRGLRGLSPQSGPEEPVLPWDQITVRLFDQESCTRLQEGPGKPPVATLCSPHSSRTSNLQVLKMQRISILQQLLQQEVEGLAARPDSSSSLDMVELQPLLMEVSRTLSASEHKSGPFHVPEPLQHAGLPKPCLLEECGEPQPAPGADPQVAQPCPAPQLAPPESCHRRAPEVPEPPAQEQPKEPEPRPPVEPLQACPPGQTGLPKPSSELEPGASEACPPNPARSPQGPPATTSLTSQSPFCASPPSCSLQSPRPPTRQAGSSSLAPRTLALRQRLKACLTTIHCFHETCLDDECAFYTSRAPPSGPSRVCANPVATLLEWQEALCFIPVSSAGPRDSPA